VDHSLTVVARLIRAGLARLKGVRIVWPTEANEVFAILPRSLVEKLRAAGSVFYEWHPDSLPDHESVGKDEVFLRFVTSFLTRARDVSAFLELADATSVPEAGAVDRAEARQQRALVPYRLTGRKYSGRPFFVLARISTIAWRSLRDSRVYLASFSAPDRICHIRLYIASFASAGKPSNASE
jgi:hypothetical protein